MKIAIIGMGAMGSLFSALLSPVSDVCLIGNFEKHAQAINQDGLTVEKTDGTSKKYHFRATADTSNPDTEFDLAIIFTKSHQTEKASYRAKPLLSQKGLALTLQNGLGNLDIIADIVGKDRAVAGVTSHGATLTGPGHVRHAGQGPTHMASSPHNARFLEQVAEIFKSAGIDVSLSENLDSLIWGKLVINVGINALTAILRVTNGVLGVTPECEKIMAGAVSEAVAVSKALGIELPYDDPLEQVKKVCSNTSGNRASMLQDILRGARTEVSVINRAIVKKGEELGIPTSYNVFLSEIIEALEATCEFRI